MNITISRASALRAASHLGLDARDAAETATTRSGALAFRIVCQTYERAVSRISGVSLRDTFSDELSSSQSPAQIHVAETLPGVGADETVAP
jgi:hypothetical protein